MSLAQVTGIWLVSSMTGKKRRERGESCRQRELLLQPVATLPTLLGRSHGLSHHCMTLLSAQASWLSCFIRSVPTSAQLSAQMAARCPLQAAATSALHAGSPFLAPISPIRLQAFLTHRWEAASQPHAVLALIQMLNQEEEQFHTPYLAWERSETAWMLPGKAAWAWAWRCWHTYPESRRRAWNLCHLTPKANHPEPFSECVGVAEGSGVWGG